MTAIETPPPRSSIDLDTRVRCSRNVFARDFEGELVLLDLARGDYYGLDEVGAALWHGLMAGRTVAEIAADLGPRYEVDDDQLRQDLVALLEDLFAKGLVEVEAAPSEASETSS